MAKEVKIEGVIGSYFDPLTGEEVNGVNLEDVVAQVGNISDDEDIVVNINSEGGDVEVGFDIYDYLKGLPNKVTTVIDKFCASIATVIALSGDEREIRKGAQFMIHNPWATASGDANKFKEFAKELQKVENRIEKFYMDQTGQTKEAIDALMKEETFLTAEKAEKLGFVTKIIDKVEGEPKALRAVAFYNKKETVMSKKVNEQLKNIGDGVNKLLNFLEGNNNKKLTLALADGDKVSIETEAENPVVGDEVLDKDGKPLSDGVYDLAEGGKITMAGGKVEKYEEAEEPKVKAQAKKEGEETDEEKLARLEKENKELSETVTNLTTERDELKTVNADLEKKVGDIEEKVANLVKLAGEEHEVEEEGKETVLNKRKQGPATNKVQAALDKRGNYKKKGGLASLGR